MELIIINENKLKIMLSREEMKKYGIAPDDMSLSFPNARGVLRDILSEASIETDFYSDTEKNRIFIQLYPSIEGGCEMFVTKIDLICSNDSREELIMPTYKEQGIMPLKSARKPTPLKRTTLTYCFKKLDWVFAACKELKKRGFSGESALYRDKEGRYYLLLCNSFVDGQKYSPSAFLSEFAELENTEHAYLYINENGYCICNENAVETLSAL